MPIEFRCHRCQKLLRTPDDTAGKQAQCPQCGEVQTIPPPDVVVPSAQPVLPPPRPENPFDVRARYNPYQSPQAGLASPIQPGPMHPRHGPPWEAEGPSPASFWSTIKAFFSDILGFFAGMRVQGGIGLPLLYMIICSVIGGAGYAIQQAALMTLGIAMPGAMQDNAMETGQAIGIVVGLGFCGTPIMTMLGSFIKLRDLSRDARTAGRSQSRPGSDIPRRCLYVRQLRPDVPDSLLWELYRRAGEHCPDHHRSGLCP